MDKRWRFDPRRDHETVSPHFFQKWMALLIAISSAIPASETVSERNSLGPESNRAGSRSTHRTGGMETRRQLPRIRYDYMGGYLLDNLKCPGRLLRHSVRDAFGVVATLWILLSATSAAAQTRCEQP